MILNKSIFSAFIIALFAVAPVMAQDQSQTDKNGTTERCTDDGSLCIKFE